MPFSFTVQIWSSPYSQYVKLINTKLGDTTTRNINRPEDPQTVRVLTNKLITIESTTQLTKYVPSQHSPWEYRNGHNIYGLLDSPFYCAESSDFGFFLAMVGSTAGSSNQCRCDQTSRQPLPRDNNDNIWRDVSSSVRIASIKFIVEFGLTTHMPLSLLNTVRSTQAAR